MPKPLRQWPGSPPSIRLGAHHAGRRDDHRAGIAGAADLRRRRLAATRRLRAGGRRRPRTPWRARSSIGIGRPKRAADLFCGIGTFALADGAPQPGHGVRQRPGCDRGPAGAVRHAGGLKPVEARVRDLFREPLSPRELARFDAVVLDPPRAGAKAQCEALASRRSPASSTCPATRPRWRAMPARWSDAGYRLGAGDADRSVPVYGARRAGGALRADALIRNAA